MQQKKKKKFKKKNVFKNILFYQSVKLNFYITLNEIQIKHVFN